MILTFKGENKMNKKEKLLSKINIDEIKKEILTILWNQEKSGEEPRYSVKKFESELIAGSNLSKKEAELVTEMIISSGALRWEIFGNNFVL